MSEDQKQQVMEVARKVELITVRGETAIHEAEAALSFLEKASTAMDKSADEAEMVVEELNSVIWKMKVMLAGSGNLDAMQALAFFERAKKQTQDYVQSLRLQVSEIDKRTQVLQLATLDKNLVPASHSLLIAAENLRSYYDAL